MNGSTITYNIPPRNFDPLKATDAKLGEYNLPTRKQFGKLWHKLIKDARYFAKPPPFLVAVADVNAGITFDNWSGYLLSGHRYTSATAIYPEPRIYRSCNSASLVEWAGLGGANLGGASNGDLGQDGTAVFTPGAANHQSWIEALPLEKHIMPQTLFATRGKDFNATVTWVRTRKREGFDFYMVNTDTKKTAASFVAIRQHDLSTAEVITERPTVNHKLRKLLNYRSIFDTGEATWGTSGAGLFAQAPHSQVIMIDSPNKTMSSPGNILGLGSWYMHFHRCS